MRGNGKQLANYLLAKADNDNVRVFHIRGTSQPDSLHKSLLEMSLTSELTKSNKGLYHLQICPAYGEDRKMTEADWLRAADLLEAETGFAGQKRVMVMHEKAGRLHMHVVYERYNHERGVMKSDSFSRLAQDRARVKMEVEFEQQRTPERNQHRPVLKEELTSLWRKTATAKEFLREVEKKGYAIAAGTERPYMVVDHTGRSFNLVRQLEGINTKEVRERFKNTKLVKEKKAIQAVRHRQEAEKLNEAQELAIDKIMLQQEKTALREEKKKANDNDKSKAIANDNAKVQKPVYTMTTSFNIGSQQNDGAMQQLQEALAKEQARERKKKKALEKLQEAKRQLALQFRENERDM